MLCHEIICGMYDTNVSSHYMESAFGGTFQRPFTKHFEIGVLKGSMLPFSGSAIHKAGKEVGSSCSEFFDADLESFDVSVDHTHPVIKHSMRAQELRTILSISTVKST